MTSSQPKPSLGQIVLYYRRDNTEDDENPIEYPPLAAMVLGYGSMGGLNLLVLGEGSEADLARGRRGSLMRSRTAVDHIGALASMPNPPARWWDFRPEDKTFWGTATLSGAPLPLHAYRYLCSCGSLWPLAVTNCSQCGADRGPDVDLWLHLEDLGQ